MFATKALLLCVAYLCLRQQSAAADPQTGSKTALAHTEMDLQTCEEQLSRYRKFMLQAILSFEDVCDAYDARPQPINLASVDPATGALYREQELSAGGPVAFFNLYQPPQQRTEIWAFFKLLMAQFNDVDFANVIRDTVIQRCRIKSQMRDEKRSSVVLGKKQRFHSWGGKRVPPVAMGDLAAGGIEAAVEDRNYF